MWCWFLLTAREPLGDRSWFQQLPLDMGQRAGVPDAGHQRICGLWCLQGSEQLLAKPGCFSWEGEIALRPPSCGLSCSGQRLTPGT